MTKEKKLRFTKIEWKNMSPEQREEVKIGHDKSYRKSLNRYLGKARANALTDKQVRMMRMTQSIKPITEQDFRWLMRNKKHLNFDQEDEWCDFARTADDL